MVTCSLWDPEEGSSASTVFLCGPEEGCSAATVSLWSRVAVGFRLEAVEMMLDTEVTVEVFDDFRERGDLFCSSPAGSATTRFSEQEGKIYYAYFCNGYFTI